MTTLTATSTERLRGGGGFLYEGEGAMYLSTEEIVRLTGFKRPSAQAAHLKARGFAFELNGLLQPLVTVAEVHRLLVGVDDPADLAGQSIYVIQARRIVKIGIASDVESRLKSFRVANPYIREAAFISERLTDAARIEYLAHQELHQFRVVSRTEGGREWFRCGPRLAIRVVKALIKANRQG